MSTNNSSEIRQAFRQALAERVLFDELLAPYVAYRVGGPADILAFPRDEADLTSISNLAKKFQLPITIIGTGTNLLVRDEGIRGVTVSLKNACQEIEIEGKGESADTSIVRVGGGVEKPTLLNWSLQNGLVGLEFSAGVPGTIGGGIFMNAGTKYGCYGDILTELRIFDFASGARQFRTTKADFGYREQKLVKDTLVLWAKFELRRGDTTAAATEVERIIAERAAKQPLDFPSCGSTFKNPDGHSAGRLIERANLKGRRVGNAEISLKHANFILNLGGAKAKDILTLIEIIKSEVREMSGVELECEVIIVGGK